MRRGVGLLSSGALAPAPPQIRTGTAELHTQQSGTLGRVWDEAWLNHGGRHRCAARGVRVRLLLEREVAWKAWYAGAGLTKHLMAGAGFVDTRVALGNVTCFIGCTPPGAPRMAASRSPQSPPPWPAGRLSGCLSPHGHTL